MATPVFNHGKNAFLALGWASPAYSAYPGVTGLINSGATGVTISGGSIPTEISGEAPIVNGGSIYGAFVGGVPVYASTAPTGSSGTTFPITNAGATGVSGPIVQMRNISPWINDIGFPTAIEPQETTTFSAAGVKSYIVGLKGYSLTFSGMYDETAAGIDQMMYEMEAFQNTAGQFVQFVYGPATPGAFAGVTPDIKYYGQGVLAKYDLKSAVAGVVTFDSEIQVTGPVYRTTL